MLCACIRWHIVFEPSHHPTPNGLYGSFVYTIEAVWTVNDYPVCNTPNGE
jgi:hypothetical protein